VHFGRSQSQLPRGEGQAALRLRHQHVPLLPEREPAGRMGEGSGSINGWLPTCLPLSACLPLSVCLSVCLPVCLFRRFENVEAGGRVGS
jgi:hypothetical protein